MIETGKKVTAFQKDEGCSHKSIIPIGSTAKSETTRTLTVHIYTVIMLV